MGFFNFLFKNNSEKDDNFNNNVSDNKNRFSYSDFDQETALEFYPENFALDSLQNHNVYAENGIRIQGVTMTLKLLYEGKLADENTDEIFAVIGYGNNLKWEDIDYYPMRKVGPKNFELMFPIKREGNINIAFKDNKDNWDNNNGMNYTFSNNYFQTLH